VVRLGGGSLDLSVSAVQCDNRPSLCEFRLELDDDDDDDEVSSRDSNPQSDCDAEVLWTRM